MKDLFSQYAARAAREGKIKAAFIGLSVGCVLLALTTLISWFFGFREGLFLGLALFVLGAGVTAPLVYRRKYRPTTKAVAARIDELGLEERLITMTELEDDPSYIAARQREDAIHALGTVDHMLVKIVISASLIIVTSVSLVLGFGMTAVDSLYYAGVLPSGMELMLDPAKPEDRTYKVVYSVAKADTGVIVLWESLGETPEYVAESYVLREGESAPEIIAVPAAGYYFAGWSDGGIGPYRHDRALAGNLSVKAIFEEIEGAEDLQDDPQGGSGQGQDSGDRLDDEDGRLDQNPPPPPPEDDDGDTGRTDGNKQIVDGETYYGHVFDQSRQDAMDRLGPNEDVTEREKGAFSDYLDAIQTGDGDSQNGDSQSGDGQNGD